MNETLIHLLGLEIVDPLLGLWRFRGEPIDKTRKSV